MKSRRNPAPQDGTPEVDAPVVAEETSDVPVVTDEPTPEVDAPVVAEAPPAGTSGFVKCRALTTCLVRGMPEFEGAVFWLDPDSAERLASKGSLVIL